MVTKTDKFLYVPIHACMCFSLFFKVAFELIMNSLQLMLVQYKKNKTEQKHVYHCYFYLIPRQHVRRLSRSYCVTINSECYPTNYFDFYMAVQYNLSSSPFKLC